MINIEQMFYSFIGSASVFQKGIFLMIIGILFVFTVQLVFYLTVKLWLKRK